ncbi:hypothetical protein, partial [Clostridioides difficile]|uniref:hypothetical protein n=1 Tax=Clostridioides difficile TaxID=1496 RepID=UPI002FD02BF8
MLNEKTSDMIQSTTGHVKPCGKQEGGPSCFPQGFTCPVVLWIISKVFSFNIQDYYRSEEHTS